MGGRPATTRADEHRDGDDQSRRARRGDAVRSPSGPMLQTPAWYSAGNAGCIGVLGVLIAASDADGVKASS